MWAGLLTLPFPYFGFTMLRHDTVLIELGVTKPPALLSKVIRGSSPRTFENFYPSIDVQIVFLVPFFQ
jgi:hypothetical protein